MNFGIRSVVFFAVSLASASGTTSNTEFRDGIGSRIASENGGLMGSVGVFQGDGTAAQQPPAVPQFSESGSHGVRSFVPLDHKIPGPHFPPGPPGTGGFVSGPPPNFYRMAPPVHGGFHYFHNPPPLVRGGYFDNTRFVADEVCPSYCYAMSGVRGNSAQAASAPVAPNTATKVEKVVTKISGDNSDGGLNLAASPGTQAQDLGVPVVAAGSDNAASTSTSTSTSAATSTSGTANVAASASAASAAASPAAAPAASADSAAAESAASSTVTTTSTASAASTSKK